MTSVKVLLYRHKILKDGTHPIMIQFIKDRKRKTVSLGQSSTAENWNDKKSLPNRSHPYSIKLARFIKIKVAEANEIVLDFDSSGNPYTLDDVVVKFTGKGSSDYLLAYFDQIIEHFNREKRKGNEIVYRCTRNSLEKYVGKDMLMSSVDFKFLTGYEEHLKSTEHKINTISVYFRTLRALLNRAIKEGVLPEESYPFKKFTIRSEVTAKRAISKEDINRIRELDLKTYSTLDITRDFFMFSFYNRGMSFVDLAFLKKSDIHEGRIVYTRKKTGQKFSIGITDQAKAIIDKYNDSESEYLFPIIRRGGNEYLDYKNAFRLMNKKLKKLAVMAGIEAELTTYVARHSWATIAKRSGISTAIISEGLGHETEETTQIYLDSFENKVLDDANDVITGL